MEACCLQENDEDSIDVSPLVGDYRDRRSQLDCRVRNGIGYFLVTMTVFKISLFPGFLSFTTPCLQKLNSFILVFLFLHMRPSRSFQRTSPSAQIEELEEIRQLSSKSGLAEKEFLAHAFAPLNERLAASVGQLVSILTRIYEPFIHSSDQDDEPPYGLEERTQVGVITDKTQLEGTEHLSDSKLFLQVRVVYPENKLSRSDPQTSFYLDPRTFAVPLLYFRDRPPVADGKILGFSEKRPRLELYIGNAEVAPFLQSRLKGYKYMMVRRHSGCDLPLTSSMEKKIQEEQLELYDQTRSTLHKMGLLEQKRDARLALIQEHGGEAAFDHGTHIELTSTNTERAAWNSRISEHRDALACCLRIAQERNYAAEGVAIRLNEDVGVMTEINMKEYFAHKIKKYASLLK